MAAMPAQIHQGIDADGFDPGVTKSPHEGQREASPYISAPHFGHQKTPASSASA